MSELKKQLNVRVEPSFEKRMIRAARKMHLSLSAWIRVKLEEALRELKEK